MAFNNDTIHSSLGKSVVTGNFFHLSQDDRRRHLYIVGQTGTGKTTMLENLILQDIHSGRGVTLIDHHLYIDEFQNFTTRKFEGILSEARKYRLSLTVAHQYLDQIDPVVLKAVLGNVGTLALFSVGASDADTLAPEFHPIKAETLMSTGRGECWVRYRSGGEYQNPEAIQGFPPAHAYERDSLERVRKNSRTRFAKRKEHIDTALKKWYSSTPDSEPIF